MSVAAILARYGLPALFLGAGFEGETVVVAGGLLAQRGIVSLPAAMAATAAGSFVADQLFFLAGRRLGGWRPVDRLRRNPLFARALAMLERHPVGFIFAFRFIYGFRTISPFAIGTSAVPARLFLAVNMVAAAIWASLFTLLGYLAGHQVEQLMARVRPSSATVAIVVGAIALVAVAAWAIRRRRA